jgi:cyclic pyranopterin phosphate synthase
LLRRELPILIQKLASIPGLADLALTTNGLLLARQAESLHQAGLRRLNISLDTLDPTRFRALSRRDGLEQILEGLEVARRFPFHSIKINAVAIRGMIELDLASLAQYCRARGFEFRVIEFMPIGAEEWERNQFVAAAELLKQIEAEVAPLIPVPDQDPHAPAQDWLFADTRTRFGVIASVSQPFCRSCNRLRLTADGKFRNCLFAREETDLKWFLRQGPQADRELEQALRAALWQKWDGHDIHAAEFLKPDRTMHRIGG